MNPNPTQSYALGHSDKELNRLSKQAQAFAPFTRQLFLEAGIVEGMRILDVGSGSGDVALLAGEIVGPRGKVTGVDRAAAAVERARGRAKLLGANHVEFLEGDPAEMKFAEQFDAVVGRLVLMYCPDAAGTLRKLAAHVRAGGLIVFQEFDEENCRSLPKSEVFERAVGWIKETLKRSGARLQTGLRLHQFFLEAGLPEPRMRIDALVGHGPDSPAYSLVAEVVVSLVPAMERLGIATPHEVNAATLEQRLRDEVASSRGVVLSPALVGAWAQKPE